MVKIDMNMPTECYECWLNQKMNCPYVLDEDLRGNRIPDECPLIPCDE